MTSAFFDAGAAPDAPQATTSQEVEQSTTSTGRKRRPSPRGLARAAAFQSIAGILWIPQAGLLAWSVGEISHGKDLTAIIPAAGLVLVLGILRAALDARGSRSAFRIARAELTRRREIAVAALSRRSPLDIARPASGFAASVLAEQAEAIVPYLARFVSARTKSSVVPLAILVCVLPVSWMAALILLLTAPLIPVFMALIGWRAQEASEKQLIKTGDLNAFLLDRLRGLATIRALDAVDATALRLRADADSLRARTMAVLRIAFLSSAVLELFAALGVAACAVYIGFSLLGSISIGTWSGKLDLAKGLFILLLAPTFFEPLRELSAVWHDRAAGEAALDALERLSAESPTVLGAQEDGEPAGTRREQRVGGIHIEDLCLAWGPHRQPVLDGFNLDIRAGEHIALLGDSGSGKTTLLSLLAGLLRSDGGSIRIGDTVLDDASAQALRRRMIWIGQRPHIFAGTLRSNIGLRRPDISEDRIRQAVEDMRFREVADAHGTNPVGEGGIGLSGGEALRLMLVRAAVDTEADIILADEPTAHLDEPTAREIGDGLFALAEGRTLIVATHDPVLAARMGRIIRIEAGAKEAAA
jgi:ATP-binding cassette subfamily C protein CydD